MWICGDELEAVQAEEQNDIIRYNLEMLVAENINTQNT